MISHVGGCQNYGPFFGTLNIRCRNVPYYNRDPKRDHIFDNHPCEDACGFMKYATSGWLHGLLHGRSIEHTQYQVSGAVQNQWGLRLPAVSQIFPNTYMSCYRSLLKGPQLEEPSIQPVYPSVSLTQIL